MKASMRDGAPLPVRCGAAQPSPGVAARDDPARAAKVRGPERRDRAYAGGVESDAQGATGDVFAESVQAALDSLPLDLRDAISNVEIVIEDEPPAGQRLLGLYRGVPLTRRGSAYGGVLPDKITVFRGPIERLFGSDTERLRREIRHVVLHEVAHHFGISDARLIELDRY